MGKVEEQTVDCMFGRYFVFQESSPRVLDASELEFGKV